VLAGLGGTPPSSKRRRTEPVTKTGVGYNIGFIGSGNMARALVEGMLGSGQVLAGTVMASATRESSENLKKMKALGVSTTTHNRDVILNSDVIVLATKPHQVLGIMTEIQAMFSDFQSRAQPHTSSPKSWRPLIVSVASSVSIADIEEKTEISWSMGASSVSGHLPVIRSLPTIASSVRAGITAYCRGKFCNEADVKPFVTLFSLCGPVEDVPEKYLDAITSVSGSGLAFAAVGLEGMADGAVLSGIPRHMALKFSAHAVMSAARLVLEKGISPANIKDSVCSPGGTTIYGIQKLEAKGTRGAYMDAVLAATERAKQLKPK
jgi:pyrroline-5-carboxylate reductase